MVQKQTLFYFFYITEVLSTGIENAQKWDVGA
jgi:hypothetical protein